MKKQYLALYLLLFLSLPSFAGPMIEISSISELDQYIKESTFNGVVLVAKDNHSLFKKAYGFRNFPNKDPLLTTDQFVIGSNTKQFIAASILKLQEEGLLSLNDSISKSIPYFLRYPEITIKDVLTHTSGITNYTEHADFWDKFYDYNHSISLEGMISYSEAFPLDFDPKSKWNYSNTGYIIAGKIIEAITHKKWNDYVTETFLNPLNMTQTGYSDFFDVHSLVKSYQVTESTYSEQPNFNYAYAASAGGLFSTVDDLLKWTAIYDNSNLLSLFSKSEMQKPILNNYGLGISITHFQDDIEISHGGSVSGFVTSLGYLKSAKLAIIALDNIGGEHFDIYSLLKNFFTNKKATH